MRSITPTVVEKNVVARSHRGEADKLWAGEIEMQALPDLDNGKGGDRAAGSRLPDMEC